MKNFGNNLTKGKKNLEKYFGNELISYLQGNFKPLNRHLIILIKQYHPRCYLKTHIQNIQKTYEFWLG